MRDSTRPIRTPHSDTNHQRCVAEPQRYIERVMRRPSRLAIVVAGSLAIAAGNAAAQSDTTHALGPVAVGARVRLWERVASGVSIPVTGRVERIAPDSITLAAESVAAPVTLAWPAVTRVEMSAGPQTGSRGAGALKGGIIGALGGAVLGVIAGNIANRNAPAFGVVGFAIGGAGGAAIGAYTPGERWQPVTPPPPNLAH
jgi:hypothetical protein